MLEGHGDAKRGQCLVLLDHRASRPLAHSPNPWRSAKLPQEPRVRTDVRGAAVEREPDGLRHIRVDQLTHLWRAGEHGQARQPGIVRKRLRNLLEDVRPNVAICIDLPDRLQLLKE